MGELADRTVLQTVLGLFKNLVPTNFVADAAANNYLPLICAALAFGAIVKAKKNEDGDEKSTALQLVEDSNAVVIGLVQKIMLFTPYGVGSLVFQALTKNDITQAADELFWLATATISGLAFHAFLVYPSLLLFAARRNPLKYIGNIVPSILTAMGTSSSAATLPVSIQMAKEKNGITDHIADFVLSLGATINMDGAGLYLICATYFLARMQAATFGLDKFLLLAVLATVTSAGSAPVPSASLVLLATIVDATGLEYNESHFGLILMIDWLLDRMRTMVNVIGDATVTAVVQNRYGLEMPEIEMSSEKVKDFSAIVKTLSEGTTCHLQQRSKISLPACVLPCLFFCPLRGRHDVGRVCPRAVVAERLQECVLQSCCTASDVKDSAYLWPRGNRVAFLHSPGANSTSCWLETSASLVAGVHGIVLWAQQLGVLRLR